MKKFHSLMLMLIAAAPLMLTSCDDDDDWYYYDYPYWGGGYYDDPGDGGEGDGDRNDPSFYQDMAATLAGDWHGETVATFVNDSNQLVTVTYYTEINFSLAADGATYGTGLQNDFEGDNQQATYSRPFQWFIDTSTGDVHLQYFSADNVQEKYEMIIAYDDLLLDERKFTGKIVAVDGSEEDTFDWDYFSTGAKQITITFTGED